MTMRNIIDRQSKEKTSLIFSGKIISFGDLKTHIKKISEILININLKKDEPIGIVFDNNPNFVYWLLACFNLKIPVALFPSYFKKKELDYHLNTLKLQYCVLQKEFIGLVTDHMDLYKQYREYDIYKLNYNDCLILKENDLIIQFTTGSCGDSKAIVRTEKSVENEILFLKETFGNVENEIYSPMAPLCHSYGLIGGLLLPLYCGYSVLLVNTKFIKDALIKISKYKVTYLFATPYIYHKFNEILSKEKIVLSNIKKCFCAGLTIDADVAKKFGGLTRLEILQDYGSTETGTMSVGNTAIDNSSDLGDFIGNAKVKVKFYKNNIGELNIKNSIIEFKYIYPDKLNVEKFKNGYYLTGDIVEVNENKLYIRGRVDDFLNVAGLKVYAKEIENTILEIEGVREVIVLGQKNKEEGDVINAFIVGEGLCENKIKMYCKRNLSDYKIPRNIFFVDEIPKNNIGKILKKYLINSYEEDK